MGPSECQSSAHCMEEVVKMTGWVVFSRPAENEVYCIGRWDYLMQGDVWFKMLYMYIEMNGCKNEKE